ncbi:MAG TPA: endolytic transglycosylase MltG [Candidatus Paceibacterota bacterium]|nr:endolytic transglycosylase MltG [Candidatus Paceibacterota bacterium]
MDNIVDLSTNLQNGVPSVPPPKHASHTVFYVITSILLLLTSAGLGVFYAFMFTPPVDFVPRTIVRIPDGASVQEIATVLTNAHIIKSPEAFAVLVRIKGDDTRMHQGEYYFESPTALPYVIDRIAAADFGIENVKVLIPEGYTRQEMAKVFAAEFPDFSADAFMNETKDMEGYLFPDTYRFFRTATSGQVVSDMRKTFQLKTADLQKEAQLQEKRWSDIVITASLVELEGKTAEDRAKIADIIYRRIAANMPLQLDAPFLYIMNKASLQLTQEDLYTQSPYNTYRNKGLPPTPIASPGLMSISAALHPIANEYLYYLSDKAGIIHYAKDFNEHRKNKQLYLK